MQKCFKDVIAICLLGRTLERLRANWESLKKTAEGEVVREDGDYMVRRGQCLPPVTLRDLFVYTVTHKV